jgi:hypothetical protein
VRAALLEDDLDRALTLGLLDIASCHGCDNACTMALLGARETRIRALAARDRFRARAARLERRKQERDERRLGDTAAPPGGGTLATPTASSPLPAAAAAALARAKAKAAAPR